MKLAIVSNYQYLIMQILPLSREIEYQNLANDRDKIMVDGIYSEIYLPNGFVDKYKYYVGMFTDSTPRYSYPFNIVHHNSSLVHAYQHYNGTVSFYNYFDRGNYFDENYIFRVDDYQGYYINDEGESLLIDYNKFYKLGSKFKIIAGCSKLEFNNFKNISFDFITNQVKVYGENTLFSFEEIGLLLVNTDLGKYRLLYDIISLDEFLKNKNYFTDIDEKKILKSYKNIINKYQIELDAATKKYYSKYHEYVEVYCENDEKFKFPSYLFPLLNNSPINCNTSFIMNKHTNHPIEKEILFVVVNIMNYMIHKPKIDFITLLKNDNIIDLNKIGKCSEYIGANIIKEFAENI